MMLVSHASDFFLVDERFHSLNARLCPLVLLLESDDLVAHRMQLLQLVFKSLLLLAKLLLLLALLLRLLAIPLAHHIHVGFGATSASTSSDEGLARFLAHSHGRLLYMGNLAILVDKESNSLGPLGCMIPVLT